MRAAIVRWLRRLAPAVLLAGGIPAQIPNPAWLLHPAPDSWPMYNGDYSGRRFSTAHQGEHG